MDSTPHVEVKRVDNRRLALLALCLLLPIPTLGTFMGMGLIPGPAGQAFFIACKVWVALLPVIWHVLVDRQRLSLSPARQGGFLVAAGLGVVMSLAIFAAWFTLGRLLIDPETVRQAAERSGLDSLTIYLLGAAYWITLNSLMEEYVWRWFVFRKFETLLGASRGGLAVLAAAAGFTAHHIVALSFQMPWLPALLASAGVFVGGVIWSWLYLRYRSVWVCYVSHAIVDVPIFIIGYWLIFGG